MICVGVQENKCGGVKIFGSALICGRERVPLYVAFEICI